MTRTFRRARARRRFSALATLVLATGCSTQCALAGSAPPGMEPRFAHASNLPLGRADAAEFVNRNGSPRITDLAAWDAFWRDISPRLVEWSADPRIDLNPNFVAALFAKESGVEPTATSWTPAIGIAQITRIADLDMRQIVAAAERWRWMHEEVAGWPRDARARRDDITKPVLDSLVAVGAVGPGEEYLLDPLRATRAALFWLRLLREAWTADEWPGAHGSAARARLNDGAPLTDAQLFDLVTVSYNQGHLYVRGLVDRHGREWTRYLNEEAADYLERVRAYTVIFQRASL